MSAPATVPNLSLPPENDDRRGWDRHDCQLKGHCRPVTALEASRGWPIETWNISAGGVAVVVCRRFEPGTLLSLSLSCGGEEVSMPLVRVMRVTVVGQHWLLGCAWVDELEKADLGLLLTPQEREPMEKDDLAARVSKRRLRLSAERKTVQNPR